MGKLLEEADFAVLLLQVAQFVDVKQDNFSIYDGIIAILHLCESQQDLLSMLLDQDEVRGALLHRLDSVSCRFMSPSIIK